jgi:beta-N-acetylhexosaminidase
MIEQNPASSRTWHPGDLLFVGFEGTELTVELRGFLREVRPGGIILFKRNIMDADQLLRLTEGLHALADPAPILAVDEEGGQVSRLRPVAPTLPASARLAALRDPGAVRDLAAALGRVLASLGFDLDFAPVVDLCRPDAPNGIGDRSFGTDPETACTMAEAYLQGLADAGILGCLKHFPGLGPTLFDSHHHLPSVQKEEASFLREDLLPYRRLHARAPAIMVGHGHYPFLAGANPIAATLVPRIATDLLRREIGFAGLALADDLEMKAVSERMSFDDLAPRTIAAGCDMALVCRSRDAILASLRALGSWSEAGRLAAERIDGALARLAALRQAVGHAAARRQAISVAAFRTASADLAGRVGSMGATA